MKKIRIASLLLVLVLATSCFVGTTFAKYTAKAGTEDSARVAEWGVSVVYTKNGADDAFAATYGIEDVNAPGTISLAVDAGAEDVVAPGTTGAFGTFDVEGAPEVAVLVIKKMTVDLGDNWNVTPDASDPNYATLAARAVDGKVFYCPITFVIDGNTVNGLDHTTVESLEGALVAAFQKDNGETEEKYYPANSDLTDLTVSNFTWTWAFDPTAGSAINQTDAYDTQLGNIFKTVASEPSILINYSIQIDQVN